VRTTDKYLGICLCYFLYFVGRVTKAIWGKGDENEKRKVLMMKFAGIGNIVMILPTIKAVRRHYPEAQIDMFTLLTNREVLLHNRSIDNTYFLNERTFFTFFVTYLRNVFRLKRERYDMVLDFEQFAKTSSVFALLIGARERIGFDTPGQGRGIAYTRRVAYMDYKHMVETFFRIAKGAGVEQADLSPVKLDVNDEEKNNVRLFLEHNNIREEDIVIGMHIGTGINMMSQRRWSKEKFAGLADMLIDEYEVRVVFTGAGDEEEKLVGETLSLMKHNAANAANKFSIKELAGFAEKCRFFVSNDTSAVHIASAMGTPVAGIYGPNTPFLYGPRGNSDVVFYKDLYCSPCITNYNAKISNCSDPVCIKSITLEEVFSGIKAKFFVTV
jgi:ADP-heptose:LPS heptosyltransferase